MSKNLNWRFEYKYRIPRVTAQTLAEMLSHSGFIPDANGSEYPVSSVYFDSPGMDDYFDKAGGFLKRKKIRARIYNEWQTGATKAVKLEIKWRKDLRIAKEHVILLPEEWELVRAGKYRELLSLRRQRNKEEEYTLRGILAQIVRDSARPKALVRYMRRPLVLNRGEIVRVNFDHALNACAKPEFWYTPFVVPVLPREEVIFEVKFNTIIPSHFADIMRGFGLSRISFSKYLESINSLRAANPIAR